LPSQFIQRIKNKFHKALGNTDYYLYVYRVIKTIDMNTFKGYEVITPKYKSWDKGLRLKVNELYSVCAHSKPCSYMWDGDECEYCGVCLTSDLENQYVFRFTKDMSVTEAVEFANQLFAKLK
jgi:hypothetical protein